MDTPKKLIITSKSNLITKYGNDFAFIDNLLQSIAEADKGRMLDTRVVYIDDPTSAAQAGITPVGAVTRRSAKQAVDALFDIHLPVYITLFGAADIFPFQELTNPVPHGPNDDDTDTTVPSDLPYACDTPYSTNIGAFTGPTRVVGRVPDLTGVADTAYVQAVADSIINYQPKKEEDFLDYFAVTAQVWQKSTQQSLINLFGNATRLLNSPPAQVSYPANTLKPLTHFYNCHGAPVDARFFGQQGSNNFPIAMDSAELRQKISFGTIVAAECCYGAELYNPEMEDGRRMGIANAYLGNGAIGFVGSSTIAYGPASGQGLADLITQYFIKNALTGASLGRAFLEAQQKFLSTGVTLDPYELKTLGQFYLLGDPSLVAVARSDGKSVAESIENRRINLNLKGINLKNVIDVSKRVKNIATKKSALANNALKAIFDEAGFSGNEKEFLFEVKRKSKNISKFTKAVLQNQEINFRVFVKNSESVEKNLNVFAVLVLKESGGNLLGWKVYHRKS